MAAGPPGHDRGVSRAKRSDCQYIFPPASSALRTSLRRRRRFPALGQLELSMGRFGRRRECAGSSGAQALSRQKVPRASPPNMSVTDHNRPAPRSTLVRGGGRISACFARPVVCDRPRSRSPAARSGVDDMLSDRGEVLPARALNGRRITIADHACLAWPGFWCVFRASRTGPARSSSRCLIDPCQAPFSARGRRRCAWAVATERVPPPVPSRNAMAKCALPSSIWVGSRKRVRSSTRFEEGREAAVAAHIRGHPPGRPGPRSRRPGSQ